jgi:hypothetical protein
MPDRALIVVIFVAAEGEFAILVATVEADPFD